MIHTYPTGTYVGVYAEIEVIYMLEQAVEEEIRKLFKPEEFSTVVEMLEATPLPIGLLAPSSRVHIAVLWLSKGSVEKLRSEIEKAARDWRDTLLASGLADENWPEVLAENGVRISGLV